MLLNVITVDVCRMLIEVIFYQSHWLFLTVEFEMKIAGYCHHLVNVKCFSLSLASLFYSRAIFSNLECSRGRKLIPDMKQIGGGGRGGRVVQNYFENFSAYLCKSQEVPKMFFKNVIFWLKKSYFLKKWGVGNQIL